MDKYNLTTILNLKNHKNAQIHVLKFCLLKII